VRFKSFTANFRDAETESARHKLLAQRLEAEGLTTPAVTRIPRRGDRDSAPLSFAQERLWFLDQFQPGNAYNLVRTYRLRGQLDTERLSNAVRAVVRRHEILRSYFSLHDGQPVQCASAAGEFRVRCVDLRGRSQRLRATESRRILKCESRRIFNLATGPLFRVTLIGLDDRHHMLLVSAHQIVFDGMSVEIFCRELETLYRSRTRDALPELTRQYGDYAGVAASSHGARDDRVAFILLESTPRRRVAAFESANRSRAAGAAKLAWCAAARGDFARS
jgi:hypothetical protein